MHPCVMTADFVRKLIHDAGYYESVRIQN